MFRKILVALDQSPLRHQLFNKATSMAKAMNAELMLLHVLTAYEDDSPGLPVRAYHAYYPAADPIAWESYQQRWEKYERGSLDSLRQLTEDARAEGIESDFTQAMGDPGRIICDVADSWNADLVIVGNRGRTGLSELLLGSVSNYVMHHAACSVLVVHSKTLDDTGQKATSEENHVAVG